MIKIPKECETVYRDKNIVLKDRKSKNNLSKFRLNNPQQNDIRVIQVDDCVIKEGRRCDYLVILSTEQEIYIELKGADVRHAVEQIARTIEVLNFKGSKQIKLCFISSTRCPINSAEIQKLKKQFKTKYNAQLNIKNGEIVHEI